MTGAARVVVVGETDPYGLTGSYARAFEALGRDVIVFDHYARIRYDRPGLIRPVAWRLKALASRPGSERDLVRTVEELQPELVFFVKCDDLTGSVYQRIRRAARSCLLAAFHPDDPFNVDRWGRGPSHARAVVQMRAVDWYFVWSDDLVDKVRERGASRPHYLAFGVDPRLHAPAEPTSASADRADVAFVGNWDPRREGWLASFEGSGLELGIWGGGYWRDRCRSRYLRSCWRGGPAYAARFAEIVASTPLAVNVLRAQNVTAHNMRTFEIPACGGAMLGEWSADQARHFEPDVEACYFRTGDELVSKARALVRSPPVLTELRQAAHARALTHRYVERARQVLGRVGLLAGERATTACR